MGLIRFIQKHNENVERQNLRQIEERKLEIMRQQQQNKQSKQVFCPHCGKSFTIEV